jgi:ABC-type sugar transport system substrate-binding protein
MANHSVPACVEAVRDCNARGQVRVVTHDSEPDTCEFLRKGWVDFSIGQDLAYQSGQALSVLFHYLVEHQLPECDAFCLPSPILNAELV